MLAQTGRHAQLEQYVGIQITQNGDDEVGSVDRFRDQFLEALARFHFIEANRVDISILQNLDEDVGVDESRSRDESSLPLTLGDGSARSCLFLVRH